MGKQQTEGKQAKGEITITDEPDELLDKLLLLEECQTTLEAATDALVGLRFDARNLLWDKDNTDTLGVLEALQGRASVVQCEILQIVEGVGFALDEIFEDLASEKLFRFGVKNVHSILKAWGACRAYLEQECGQSSVVDFKFPANDWITGVRLRFGCLIGVLRKELNVFGKSYCVRRYQQEVATNG